MENTSLAQRIIGAIVIISLAIIFIPVLLETNRLDEGDLTVSPIPEVPREISTIVFQLNEDNGKFEGEGLTASDRLTAKANEAINNSAKEVELELPKVDVGGGKTDSSKADANTIANTSTSKAALPVLDDGQRHSWMLQLASFKQEKNALKLRDKLRAKQYVSHVDERKLSAGSVWRVRIGPVLSKAKIVKIQTVLNKEMGMKGLIIRRR